MARKRNFGETTLRRLYTRTENISEKAAIEYAKKMGKLVRQQNERFFDMLSAKIIGAKRAPRLAGESISWAKLTQKYVRWKKKKKRNSGFYSNTKKLKRALARMDANAIWGGPAMGVEDIWSEGVAANVETAGRRKDGNWILRARRITDGRFVSMDKIRRRLGSKIKLRVFRDLPKTQTVKSLTQDMPDPDRMYHVFSNPRPRRASRPILVPYLRWYINVHTKRLLDRINK